MNDSLLAAHRIHVAAIRKHKGELELHQPHFIASLGSDGVVHKSNDRLLRRAVVSRGEWIGLRESLRAQGCRKHESRRRRPCSLLVASSLRLVDAMQRIADQR
jgi:hypothetical protein